MMMKLMSPRRMTAQKALAVIRHRKRQEEHLTPLTLFTPRKITAPVFRRAAAST